MMANVALAQFYVIVRRVAALDLERVPVTSTIQEELANDFLKQMGEFFENKIEIDFSPSYEPGRDEIFRIKNYDSPTLLQRAVTSPHQFQALKLPFTPLAPVVKAVLVAIPANGKSQPLYLFQHFDRRRILDRSRTLIFRHGTFGHLQNPGVTIGDHLDAVIQNGKLFFHSFHMTSQFLPLADYFEAATDDDIREFAAHRLFVDGKAEKVIATANQITRKRISIVLKGGILDTSEATAEGIQAAAKKVDIDLKLKGKAGKRQIIFPEQPSELRLFLQFLAEGFYIGLISGEPYVANSYRKLR